ncbi:MAG TPA: hypothetical protein VLO29_02285, partial [Salegentibacter sp.]|nr:hypothetical protein [Salegentibacter sp.]
MNLKFTTKLSAFIFGLFLSLNLAAQEVIVTDSTAIKAEDELAQNTTEDGDFKRKKVDGIAAVIGDYIVLDSDIQLMYKDM